ncbi:MAG: uroporphyrinogen-III synthase [Bacteroidales bacterium]|nr:uroporphyrinogen-III synthase [Bacteroidales bacterium]
MPIRKILVAQQEPSNLTHYSAISTRYGVSIDFHPFFLIEPLSSREFRSQRVNLPDYTAVVFSSRHAIDAYFALCEECRFKVPETMKYFCSTEVVAMYLQKHIIYRKRKIFFGNGTPASIVAQIGSKHKGEKFLLTTSDTAGGSTLSHLFDEAGLDYTTAVLVKSVSQDLKGLDLSVYDVIALHNPADVKALFASYPDFKQGEMKFISFGKSIVKAMDEAGLTPVLQGPTPQAPSLSKALEQYLSQNN